MVNLFYVITTLDYLCKSFNYSMVSLIISDIIIKIKQVNQFKLIPDIIIVLIFKWKFSKKVSLSLLDWSQWLYGKH